MLEQVPLSIALLEAPVAKSAALDVSVIMPAYNEEANIADSIAHVEQTLCRLALNYHIVVVDDGSLDRTSARAQQQASKNGRVTVVGYRRNMGKGFAFRTGLAYAGAAEGIVLLDSDSEIPCETLSQYIRALEDADLIISSKRHPMSSVQAPFSRKFLSLAFHVLCVLLTGVKVRDTQSGLKAFRKSALDRIARMQLVKRYAFDVEVLTIALMLKLRVAELPVTIELRRAFGVRNILHMLLELLGIAYRLHVKRWYRKNLNGASPSYQPLLNL